MVRDYVHQEFGQDIEYISGTYTPLKELRLIHSGRDIQFSKETIGVRGEL